MKKQDMKRKIVIAAVALVMSHCSLLTAHAQTETDKYIPGVTAEGAIYFLPKTAIRVAVKVEKTTYTPGDFAPYAERYLRLSGVSMEPSTSYRVISVTQTAFGVRDAEKSFAVKLNKKTSAVNLAQTNDGVLLAVNAESHPQEPFIPFQPVAKPAAVNPRQFMNEEILAAGSTAKMAQLTAQEIYDIRSSRSELVKGQADFMPKDGEQMKLMLSQMDQQDHALTSLFAGVTTCDTTEQVFVITPDTELQQQLLFRFSRHFGLVDADDVSGTPYYINIRNLTQLPPTDEAAAKKMKKTATGLYYNVPGRLRATIYRGNDEVTKEDFPAAQFGNVELLSGELFNKHFGTRLWLNPLTGDIEKLEAEQPK